MELTPITIEALIADGWQKTGEEVYFLIKKLENINPLNAGEDSDIKLTLHGMYNSQTFAVILPDGGLLNFSVSSMEELKAFETAISFYAPPF